MSNKIISLFSIGKTQQIGQQTTNNYGLDEEAVNTSLDEQTKQLTQELKAQGHAVTAVIEKKLRDIVESKFVEFACDIRAEQVDGEESVKKAIQKKFKELQDGNAVLFENFSAALDEKLAEGNKLLQAISKLQDKAAYYAEERYNALFSRLDDIRERVDRINDREARKDRENIFFLQKKLEHGHSALQSAEFVRAKKYFETITESNVGGSDFALVANAYFGIALAEWQIQLIWDDVNNSERFILYNYDIDLSENHGTYREAIDNATTEQADLFRKFVATISCTKSKLCDYRDKELSYDCFLCTKVTEDENEAKTDDFEWIENTKLYELLKESNPFYSEVDCPKNLAKKGTLEYESLIYYALSRAKVMLLVCSDKQYLETPWVENEIHRFRQFCTKRGDNPLERIIIVHKDKAVELQSDLDERYQGWNRNKIDVDTIVRTVKAAVANASGYVESGWRYCPQCGKRYSLDMEECSSRKCLAYPNRTPLVDELTWANKKYTKEIEKLKQEILKLKQEIILSGSERNTPQKQAVLQTEAVKFCISCGAQNPGRAKYCMECGGTTFAQNQEEAKRAGAERRLIACLQRYLNKRRAKGQDKIEYDKTQFEIEGTTLKKYLKRDFVGEVKIPLGVKSIGDSAFFGCSGLISVMIPNSVTSIGESAFEDCSGLTSVTISYGVQSIGKSAFYGCSGLTFIMIPESVTSIGVWAFSRCNKLEIYCKADQKPSGWDAFWNPDHRPVKWNCNYSTGRKTSQSALEEPTLEDYDKTQFEIEGTTLKKYLKSDFAGEVKIPFGVTSIGQSAFYGFSRLTSIIIPNSVTLIGKSAFFGCSGLTSITIPNSVTLIGESAFSCCNNLGKIEVEEGNSKYRSEENCLIEISTNKLVAGCKRSTIPYGVKSIGAQAFYGCSGLIFIKIPNSVKSIGAQAFYGCSGLISIKIPNSIKSIGKWAFQGCSGLTSIRLPNSVTSIGDLAFSRCNKLKIYCEAAQKPSGWREDWNSDHRPVKWDCKFSAGRQNLQSSLDHPTLKNYDKTQFEIEGTTLKKYLKWDFAGEVKIPLGIKSIGKRAFYGCSRLTSIMIPNSVTTIKERTFYGCSGLISIELPNNLTSIGESAFAGCEKLEIFCEADQKPSGWDKNWNPDNRPIVWGYKKK